MTAMRNGVYALLAVVVGVMLVGVLPGQLSNLAAPQATPTFTLSSRGESAPNATSTQGTTIKTYGASNSSLTGAPFTTGDNVTSSADAASTAASTAGTKSDAATTAGATLVVGEGYIDPYADLRYYGFWGVGLVAALAVYFVAKRMLG